VSTIQYSTMNPKPDMIALSCAVQKELQRVAAAATYNAITQKFPTKIEKQRVLMGSYFHGDGETISSQAEQLVEGEEGTIYHSLYKSFTEISVDRNDATNAMQKRLKKTFSREPNIGFIVGTQIKAEYIKAGECKISNKIDGRQLHNMALEVAKKYKIAKSFAKDFLISKGNIDDGDFQLPSGTVIEDVLKYIIDKMFIIEEIDCFKDHFRYNNPKDAVVPSIVEIKKSYQTRSLQLLFLWILCFCFVWTISGLFKRSSCLS